MGVKYRDAWADIGHMIISDEQARLAAQYLKTAPADNHIPPHPEVSDELLVAVRSQLADVPEYREDRVHEAAERLSAGELDPHDVAEKMISRILSDAIR